MNTHAESWLAARERYSLNLESGIGHRESILAIIAKIDQRLAEIAKLD
jgi:hypothetical protein